MKLPWLLPVLLAGSAASTTLDRGTIAAGTQVFSTGGLLRGLLYGKPAHQLASTAQSIQNDTPIPSHGANTLSMDLNTSAVALPQDQTRLKLNAQPREDENDGEEESTRLSINYTTNASAPPDPENPSARREKTGSSRLDCGPGPGPDVAVGAGSETRNPASANRAIAGMSAGLVSVMLVFTVFL